MSSGADQPGPDAGELAPEESALGDTLIHERPFPRASFRGALGRYLAAEDPGYGPRLPRLRMTVAALALVGLALIAVGLAQALGSL